MFKACFKKDWLEQVRNGKLFIFLAMGVGIALFSVLSTFIVGTIMADVDLGGDVMIEQLESMFTKDYAASLMYFMSFMVSYFAIILIIMVMNVINKEIKNKKWIAPMCSGVSPENMILSKILVTTLSVLIGVVSGCLAHFLFTIILFKPTEAVGAINLFQSYGVFVLFTIFTTVITMCINAITKKGWVSPLIMIAMLILGTSIMQVVQITSTTTLIMYTPYAFYDLSMTFSSFAAMGKIEWVISSLTYVLVTMLMLYFAVKSNKIKASKN